MKQDELLLARLYAKAFLNVYGETVTDHTIKLLEEAAVILPHYKLYLTLLNMSSSISSKLDSLISSFMTILGLPSLLSPLVKLLVNHNRAMLILTVLRSIIVQYQKRNDVCKFHVLSSHLLEGAELEGIIQFLAAKTGCSIIYKYNVAPSLIAGVRLQSNEYLWEHSVRKNLQRIGIAFKHQEQS